jgi:hypothetical protein
MASEIINLNDSSPAAPAGHVNVKWQKGASSGTDPATGLPVYPVSANAPVMVGDTGSGGAVGFVPAPAAGDAAAGKYLKADGTWDAIANLRVAQVGITLDGGSALPGIGSKGYIQVNFNATITGWTLVADLSGSAQITVKKSTYAGFPTTASIVASAPPKLTSAQKNTDSTLTGWTTAIAAGDVLEFNLDSVTTCTRLNLTLTMKRT